MTPTLKEARLPRRDRYAAKLGTDEPVWPPDRQELNKRLVDWMSKHIFVKPKEYQKLD